jgi:hypothetical protein
VLFIPRESRFISIMVLGFREGHPMCVVTNMRKETDEGEKVAPLVVR